MSYIGTKNPHLKTTKRPDGSIRQSLTCKVLQGEPRTEQSHKSECDIRNIVRRYKEAGQPFPSGPTEDVDLTSAPSFFEAQLTVARGMSMFHTQPAAIRDRFRNDPNAFLAFFADPANQDEAVKLGLAKRKPLTEAGVATPSPKSKGDPLEPVKTPSGKPDGGQPKGGSKSAKADSDQ